MKKETAWRYALLGAGALLLVTSFFFAFWELEIKSPSRAEDLAIVIHVGHVEGIPDRSGLARDVEPERLELSATLAAGVALAFLGLAAFSARSRWSLLLWAPAALYPFALLLDSAAWISTNAHVLAGTSSPGLAIEVAVPLWGRLEERGVLLVTHPSGGFFLSLAAGLVLSAGVVLGELRKAK